MLAVLHNLIKSARSAATVDTYPPATSSFRLFRKRRVAHRHQPSARRAPPTDRPTAPKPSATGGIRAGTTGIGDRTRPRRARLRLRRASARRRRWSRSSASKRRHPPPGPDQPSARPIQDRCRQARTLPGICESGAADRRGHRRCPPTRSWATLGWTPSASS
jgi:hypothetical protein